MISPQLGPEFWVLHTLRMTGFGDLMAISGHADLPEDVTATTVDALHTRRLIQHDTFGDFGGWSLTATGTVHIERILTTDGRTADATGLITQAYRTFASLNPVLLQAVTNWQVKPQPGDRLSANDHCDAAWDREVIKTLTSLSREVTPVVNQVASALARFARYSTRLGMAMGHTTNSHHDWLQHNRVDTYHRVWHELHEDFLVTLGRDRSLETAD